MIARVLVLLLLLSSNVFAQRPILNVYGWPSEIPDFVIRQFEKETGIKVNFSTYDNNEIMYAKLRAVRNAGYDIVMPSGYYVDRMRHQNMLEPIDKTKLTNWNNLDPAFLHAAYDPEMQYSIPYLWGITGIFYNKNNAAPLPKSWSDLWDHRYANQLMLLDDIREVFSMGLLSLGFSANDTNPSHIQAAYLKLKTLMPNVKVFSSDTVVSILIDEDANTGMVWNGDAYKASQENANVQFVFPSEGFVIWMDNFAIPKNAPHKEAAYLFLNFMLRAEVAKEVALYTNFPIANLAGKNLLPSAMKNNPWIYPSKEIMKHGQYQTDVGDAVLRVYEKYWEELKMGG